MTRTVFISLLQYGDSVQESVVAVRIEGLKVRDASEQYKIPNTILGEEVAKSVGNLILI